ncbi:hypothetical protein [Parabacteroides sp. FAFU027]|uniref:hypothetical protein n=1 Tax=Parabacteroides sp. FAFU027 TaxID=2922715 RepID=UPI001FAEE01E|nr:hypothetical protein [Parabacteroides sp. FAFU027]
MKAYPLLLIFITILFISCNSRNKISILYRVNPFDTACINQLKLAQEDIRNNNLVYCNYIGGPLCIPLRPEKEMDSLLRKYQIKYQDKILPDIRHEFYNDHCYCELMKEKIDEKYGRNFIDSLLYKADSLYITKHPDNIFENTGFNDDWDTQAYFPGDTIDESYNHSALQRVFNSKVKYPKDYRYKRDQKSNAAIYLTIYIDRTGVAKVKSFSFLFNDSKTNEHGYNLKHRLYLLNLAKNTVENTKWIPAKIKNMGVNSIAEVTIKLE